MTPEQLKLLSPAPWEAMVQEWQPPQVVCNDRTAGAIITGEAKQAVAWATFIAIARNAFDVMARRKWFPRFIGTIDGKDYWVAYSWVALKDVSEIAVFLRDSYKMCDIRCTDPFTALVEADAWYKANVEGNQ